MRNKFNQIQKTMPKVVDMANPELSQQITAKLREGLVLHNAGQLKQARVIYEEILKFNPKHFNAMQLLGALLIQIKQWNNALTILNQALKINSTNPFVYNNRGVVLKELLCLEEALTSYDNAIELKRDYAEAYSNRGIVLKELKRLAEALASYDKAIELKPDYAEAINNRGNVLKELKRLAEALASYDRAIELKRGYADAYLNRGIVLDELERLEEALKSYDRAIELLPNYAEAYVNRGDALKELKRPDEALSSYEKAIDLKRDYEYLFGTILHTKMFICNWQNFNLNIKKLLLQIANGYKSSSSFIVLALIDSPLIQHKVSEIWLSNKNLLKTPFGFNYKRQRNSKIRIGYYSADFRNHATAYLMAELFELHDKNKFELIAFSFRPGEKDEMRQRLLNAFDQFIDVSLKSDKDIALLSREINIDIAVDLMGFTKNNRVNIFSYRAAPIQVNYLGYPGTMVAEYIDYIIADRTLIPIQNQQHYSEKIVYLPNSYQANDRQRVMADKVFTKEELNLPNDGFVFCCLNNNFKITPETFDGWMRILKAVEGSVLWLLEDNLTAGINLRKEAQNRGIDPKRLVFANRMKLPEHLARHKAADLFIDTLPYNAHTTASDALWAGLPVLTCMGECFASRVAASLLNAIELPELITTTQEQYVATAIELATNPAKLKEIKQKLERNRLTTALFDSPQFTKHIEAAFTQMYERYQANLPPDHIYIEA